LELALVSFGEGLVARSFREEYSLTGVWGRESWVLPWDMPTDLGCRTFSSNSPGTVSR
jgi:hypothetical protein